MKVSSFLPNNIFVVLLNVGAAMAATLLLSPLGAPVASPLFLVAVMISARRGGLF